MPEVAHTHPHTKVSCAAQPWEEPPIAAPACPVASDTADGDLHPREVVIESSPGKWRVMKRGKGVKPRYNLVAASQSDAVSSGQAMTGAFLQFAWTPGSTGQWAPPFKTASACRDTDMQCVCSVLVTDSGAD